jgi:hypothetical protein
MPQLIQQAGRSNRTRGACYLTYFLNTEEDKEQVKLRLTRTIASELNSTVELTQLLRKVNPWYNKANGTVRRDYIRFALLLAEQVILRNNVLPTTVESVSEYVGVNAWFDSVSKGALA